MNKSLEDRMVELEMRLAHQEQAADDLTEVVVRQTHDIEALNFELKRMRSRILTALDMHDDASPQDNRPPPHY